MVFEGKLIEVSETGLELEIRDDPDASLSPGSTTVPYGAIRSLERPRDSTANGTQLGLLIGAGFAGGLFVVAYSKDANEFDSWGPEYALFALFTTGVGAATGWLVDRLRSSPLQYDRPGTAGPVRFRAAPILNGDTRGVSVAIRF